jgi:hypothetical protein
MAAGTPRPAGPAPREAGDVIAFGQESGRVLSDGRIVGRAGAVHEGLPLQSRREESGRADGVGGARRHRPGSEVPLHIAGPGASGPLADELVATYVGDDPVTAAVALARFAARGAGATAT